MQTCKIQRDVIKMEKRKKYQHDALKHVLIMKPTPYLNGNHMIKISKSFYDSLVKKEHIHFHLFR